ncbi:MAG: myxococcus cysteine-rich repeat containing protein [Thermoanaerobaculia bacterium]|nr:myxococcus cysteine-rich repeat containing protein [Thermoanaerobaculia bacterium]
MERIAAIVFGIGLALGPVLWAAAPAAAGNGSWVVNPEIWNATTNDTVAGDDPPGLAMAFSFSSAQSGSDTVEDAFGNRDGGVEPTTFIFGDGGTADDGDQVFATGGETVDFIEWQTTSPVTVYGYSLSVSQFDPFGRTIQLFRFLVDGVEEDFFDNDGATGPDNSTLLVIERPFAGGPVTGSTFRVELTRTTNGPRITEIDALTESFCGNGTVEGPEECDDANTVDGDGCTSECLAETVCPVAPTLACSDAAKVSLAISEKKPGKEKLKASLKGFDMETMQASFGDPATGTSRYDLCIYDDVGVLVGELSVDRAGDLCGPKAKPCWKAKGDKGYAYKDPDAASAGVKKIAVKAGPVGKGKMSLQAGNKEKKGQLAMPLGIAAALQGQLAPQVQLYISDGACLEATLTTIKKSLPTDFKAK